MNQMERINMMESCLDEAQETLQIFFDALKGYIAIQPKLLVLADYYLSDEWRKDYEDDEAGRLPQHLKRGVLSEDAVYNLLEANKELHSEILTLDEHSKFLTK